MRLFLLILIVSALGRCAGNGPMPQALERSAISARLVELTAENAELDLAIRATEDAIARGLLE